MTISHCFFELNYCILIFEVSEVGKREDNAIATRKKLISTANQLIVQHGYENISVDTIVKASGIAKGTFYNYFVIHKYKHFLFC